MEDKKMKREKDTTKVIWVKAPPHMGDGRAFHYTPEGHLPVQGISFGAFRWGESVEVPNSHVTYIKAMVNDDNADFGEWKINGEMYPKKKPAPAVVTEPKESDA